MGSSLRRLYQDLRSICVVLVYPPGEDRDIIVQQLNRIGCRLKTIWPFPAEPPGDADVIFFQVSQDIENPRIWTASTVSAALVALADYESPTILKLLLDSRAHGVISKPFRSSGILSTLVLARASHNFQERLQTKIDKLETTIKSRRQIEKAIQILVRTRQITDVQAYEHMRERATSLQTTVAAVATKIVQAHETMQQLGLGGE